jgi:hypothetical protein
MGVFYSDDWVFSEDETVLTVTGHDILALYDDVNYVDNVAYEDIDGILTAPYSLGFANILNNVPGVYYIIDTDFDDTYYIKPDYATYKSDTCRKMLSEIITSAWTANSSLDIVLPYCHTDKFGNVIINGIENIYGVEDNAIENYYKLKKENTYYKNLNKFEVLTDGGVTEVEEDLISQSTYGIKTLTISNNRYVRSSANASALAFAYKSFYANVNSANDDVISLDWWGNPSLEIYDNVLITNVKTSQIYSCKLISNNYNYNAFLKCTSRFKVLETTTP